MKKYALLSIVASFSLLAMSCSSASSDEFVSAAKQRNFDVSQDLVDENTWHAVRGDCEVIFYDENSTNDADVLYREGLKIKKEVEQSIGSKQQAESNFIGYHHFSIKTASKFVYGTQIKNTFLFFDGKRECEEYLEPMLETLGHHY